MKKGVNIVTLYDYLLEKYGFNEPILTTEIRYKDYSKPHPWGAFLFRQAGPEPVLV